MNSDYIVYKITNKVNSKVYIGITKCTLNERWINHKSSARTGQPFTICRAIRKYGEENFTCEEICHAFGTDNAEYLEAEFIKEFDSIKSGYNMVQGGNAFKGLSGELNGMYGKTHTPEVKKKLAEDAKERFKGKSYDELYGKERASQLKYKRSQEMKVHRAKCPVNGAKNPRARTVHIKGLEFPTAREAAHHFSISPSTLTYWLKNFDDCWYV